MSTLTIYLLIATTIILGYSLFAGRGGALDKAVTAELCALSLVTGLGVAPLETISTIVIISAITVFILAENLDSDTALLFQLGVIGLVVLGEAEALLVIYLGIELIGLAFYVLAGRERKGMKSTEAGIKYFILGALSSGIFLLGVTIVFAQTGSTDLELIGSLGGSGGVLIIVGLLFKLGAAPFHMWVPDVYEGASTIVTTFFAVVPKIAYLGVLMKLGGGDLVILGGILSIIVGSIGAINQTKIKRMLAYSAIGHVGFMLIGVGVASFASIQATIIYMIIYIIMTVNSFTIVLTQGIQKIVELRGLSRRNSVLGMTMGLGLMSIAGIPPLAGFYNKYLVLLSAVEQAQLEIAIIAVLLSVISGFYYVRIIRFMYFKDKADIVVETPVLGLRAAIILGATTFAILSLMVYPSVLAEVAIPGIY